MMKFDATPIAEQIVSEINYRLTMMRVSDSCQVSYDTLDWWIRISVELSDDCVLTETFDVTDNNLFLSIGHFTLLVLRKIADKRQEEMSVPD